MAEPTAVPGARAELNDFLRELLPGARLQASALPQSPAISLYLLNEDYPQHELDADTTARLMDEPAYWAFCWASGQVLARYLLENPQMLAGKRVLDFGAGSGVAGIAAAKSGASEVIACDMDPIALTACRLNAALNGVQLETLSDVQLLDNPVDVILVADVFYDRANLPLLATLEALAAQLIIADSRLKDFKPSGYCNKGRYHSHTVPDLNESEEFNWVNLWQGRSEPKSQGI